MNGHEARRYSMFGRVATFGKAHAANFESETEATLRFAAMTRIIHEIGMAAAGQRRGRGGAKQGLFDRLRAAVRDIARSARVIGRHEPGFADTFRLPNSSSHTRLLTAVDAMLVELEWPHVAAKFIAQELPVDFVQRLADDRQALAHAQDELERDDATGIASTAALKRLIREGMNEVAYLDAIVRNKYRDHPEYLHVWRRARRLERARRRKKQAARGAGARGARAGHADGNGSRPPAAGTATIRK